MTTNNVPSRVNFVNEAIRVIQQKRTYLDQGVGMNKRIKRSASHYGLPECLQYHVSLAHPETVSHAICLRDGLFMTASIDGFVQLSRYEDMYESLKIFKVHSAPLTSLTSSDSKRFVASVSLDKTIKLYSMDIWDVVKIYKLSFIPECSCVIDDPMIAPEPVIIVAPRDDCDIYYCLMSDDGLTKVQYPEQVLQVVYNKKLKLILLVLESGHFVYVDVKRLIGCAELNMTMKTKVSSRPNLITFSPNCELFSYLSQDRIVKVHIADSFKVYGRFDESIGFYENAWEGGRLKLSEDQYRVMMERERELERTPYFFLCNVIFDSESRVIVYSSAIGIKAVDLEERSIICTYKGDELAPYRPVQTSLIEGKNETFSVDMAASDNPKAKFECKSVLISTGLRQPRFYIYTNEPNFGADRDGDCSHFPKLGGPDEAAITSPKSAYIPGHKAVIRTTLGDIVIQLFPALTPLTVENFCTLARTHFYDNLLFHRVIRGFMVQTGCPKGDGTGGESIWGGYFQNELSSELKHDRPFLVSMANSGGPRTNGSQFFITTIRAPWLDRKHTVFGRVKEGEDVVRAIESVETDRLDRPKQDVRVLTIEIIE